jgi:endonuclease YncB( thermonuclease family)
MQPRRSLAILLMFSAALAVCSAAFADDLIGQASIIDGDTIEIHGTRIRIFGIDAPESDQLCRNEESELYRCGQKASNALFDFIARRPIECVEVDRDRYQRAVAVCTVGGTDIADWLVRNGLALDWPRYSKGDYSDAQAEAKREQRGMWGGP